MKVSVEAPDDFPAEAAQQCFLMGLKVYTSANNAGLCVVHGVERDEDTAMMVMAFRGEYAAAVMKFCQGVRYLSGSDPEKNLAVLRDRGAEMLRRLQHDEGK